MKRLAILLLILTLTSPLSGPARAAEEAPPGLPAYDWLSQHREEALDMLRKADPGAADVLKRLGEAWRQRDGTVAMELADFFVEAICHHAPALIRALRENMEAFHEWLERIPGLILTDYRDEGVAHMEELKERLIACIDQALESERDEDIRDGLITVRQRFVDTHVRIID